MRGFGEDIHVRRFFFGADLSCYELLCRGFDGKKKKIYVVDSHRVTRAFPLSPHYRMSKHVAVGDRMFQVLSFFHVEIPTCDV